jgi:outer membrane lipoprotein-sorting protein
MKRNPLVQALPLFASVWMAAALSAAGPAPTKDAWPEVQTRMDHAAATFQSMTAKVKYLTHTDVLDENSEESGTLTMRKAAAREAEGLIEFTGPNPRVVVFAKRQAQIFYPKINTVNVYDLGKHGEQLDQFLMTGFGTSGSELAHNFDVKAIGVETVQKQRAIKLQLVPKTGEARQYVKKLELWIPETGRPYPLQEKLYEPSGDYRLITYSDLTINPALAPDALKLKTPAGVKYEQMK